MKPLLKFAEGIDWLNARFGAIATWLVLLACLISAGNAMVRYGFSISSNAWLEVQWHMFAGVVMMGAAYTLRMNEHVRVDVIYGRLGARTRAWVDLLGMLAFLLPVVVLMARLSWPVFATAFSTNEMSNNPGGLPMWPAKAMLPLGFVLLTLQGVSEIIKRVGYLLGTYEMNTFYERPLQ